MKQSLKVIRDEFVAVVQSIENALREEDADDILETGKELEKMGQQVGQSWSGSWLGYHSRVYYAGLRQPPPNAFFDREWGMDSYSSTQGDWRVYNADALRDEICRLAGVDDLEDYWPKVKSLREAIKDAKDNLLSCFLTYAEFKKDQFMQRLQEEVEGSIAPTTQDFFNLHQPKGQFFSRDSAAVAEGLAIPPHVVVTCQGLELKGAVITLKSLSKICLRAAGHIDKFSMMTNDTVPTGKKVFIGHGRSLLWRELKDFVQDRLRLPWDEFNRVPVAGLTTISRIESMLHEAAFAFLVMTAEDEQADEQLYPRLNVVHEAGLFQGRLGFSRAIIVLEEGCQEFSNIVGLSQIRFPKGNIKACFEEVRQVLEREHLS